LALVAALSVCDRVTTFGFSREASRDAKSSSFAYHYFKVGSSVPLRRVLLCSLAAFRCDVCCCAPWQRSVAMCCCAAF
jgi:hypothetical protein